MALHSPPGSHRGCNSPARIDPLEPLDSLVLDASVLGLVGPLISPLDFLVPLDQAFLLDHWSFLLRNLPHGKQVMLIDLFAWP